MDQRLRATQRRAVATDEVGPRVALHVERLRSGLLSVERLRLASYLVDPAARHVVGLVEVPTPFGLGSRARGLKQWGRMALVRGAIALLRAGLTARGLDPPPTLRAVEEWVACPCAEHVRAAAAARSAGPGQVGRVGEGEIVSVVACLKPPQAVCGMSFTLNEARRLAAPVWGAAVDERLWDAVRAALLPWCTDPDAPFPSGWANGS